MAYWLIEKIEDVPMGVLTVDLAGGRRTLPVFSHREEAEMYLWLGRLADGWRARMRGVEDIARALDGPCAMVEFVSLDPLPEMMTEGTIGLVSLRREQFVGRLEGAGVPERQAPNGCRGVPARNENPL